MPTNETTAIATTMDGTSIVEAVVTKGDLSDLTAEQKARYYIQICESLGLNPYTQPFGIYSLQGKQVMYAKKDAAEQLRRRHKVSITHIARDRMDDILIVTVTARTPDGREDSDVGAVNIANLRGEALANAVMKGITKGKRRVTLSLCGLGMLDETEVDTIPDARPYEVNVETGEIIETAHPTPPAPRALVHGTSEAARPASEEQLATLHFTLGQHSITPRDVEVLARLKGYGSTNELPAATVAALIDQAKRQSSEAVQSWFAAQFQRDPVKTDAIIAELDAPADDDEPLFTPAQRAALDAEVASQRRIAAATA